MKIFTIVPLFAVYLGVILVMHYVFGTFPGNIDNYMSIGGHILKIPLPSGASLAPTWGSFMLMVGVVVLYFELMKSTHTSDVSSIEHGLSAIIFVMYLGLWITQGWANNDVMMILTGMAYVDVVAGFTITIAAARRDLAVG
jgi:hypothetical protein